MKNLKEYQEFHENCIESREGYFLTYKGAKKLAKYLGEQHSHEMGLDVQIKSMERKIKSMKCYIKKIPWMRP